MTHYSNSIVCLIVIVYVVLSFTVTGIESSTISSEWVTKCHDQGFDPVQLACKTCNLLLDYTDNNNNNNKQILYEQCMGCCSNYMDIERITKPFQSAIIVLMTSKVPTDGEIGNFFTNDWETIQDNKGSNKIIKIIDENANSLSTTRQRQNQQNQQFFGGSMFQMFSGFGRNNIAEVLFFDDSISNIKKRTKLNYETMSKIAKETIPLSDMKRDDMKDMIMTLLP
jgi:hypothetical protein